MKVKKVLSKGIISLLVASLILSGTALTTPTANATTTSDAKGKAIDTMLDYYNSQITTIGAQAIFPDVIDSEGVSDDAVLDDEGTAGEITTFGAAVMWKTSKTYKGMEYGAWETVGVRKASKAPGKVKFTFSKKVSTSFSGSIKVGVKKVESVLGFKLNSQKTTSFENSWDCKANVSYKAQLRARYKVYQVKQTKTVMNTWTGQQTVTNYYVKVKKDDSIDVRVI
ncbi:hypothetical protein HCJ66_14290 [Listeria sp. FSL L7-1582]|uniref:hypothetical protein n=1 Tax=Listeria portnoyi TaxID=2713504 RepID=UPI00164E91B9|nr:hypothetical protein [Listeria portnoyi]MBC6310706.1 hypothetical protein [Listeria portnoyi]